LPNTHSPHSLRGNVTQSPLFQERGVSTPTTPIISGTTTPPSINIQGSNPATINVGDTYTDLGAIVHDNQGHDLSYRTFINGVLSGNILIDTSQVATDTIYYVATDTWGTGNPIRFYVDGALAQSSSVVTDTLKAWSGFWIGRYSGGVFYPGAIDDVRIYNRALSAQEVQQLYAAGR
jgi:Concanavalin A-like lectin/glucanases superfamily